jgi:acetyltransferase-like isoleucine patch superfamily enzyme
MTKGKFARMFTRLISRAAQYPRIILYKLMSTNIAQGQPICIQPVQFCGEGDIVCEKGVKIGVFPSPFFYSTYGYIEARSPSSLIRIGADTWINNNFCAIADCEEISIGKNCFIGFNVEITNSDFHPTYVTERRESQSSLSQSVHIGDEVFIGSNVKIVKGVSIGDRSVIANGSVVTRDILSDCVAGGVPAKTIKMLD